jgi:hypothetical protein
VPQPAGQRALAQAIRAIVRPGQAERFGSTLARVEVWEHEPNAAEPDGFAAEVEGADRLA